MAKMLFCLIILDETTINAITLEDLKDYYNRKFSPSVANFQIVGAISQKEVNSLLVIKKWKPKIVNFPEVILAAAPRVQKFILRRARCQTIGTTCIGYPALQPQMQIFIQ
jgi:predicted Zn-dependent peptidase